VLGRAWKSLPAGAYYQHRCELWQVVTGALDRLRRQYDLIIAEGAGSPAELNLRQGDIVNMAVALYAQAPVLLVGDIDRGGIFAQLLGTLWLLPENERRLVRGFLVNKFRGDPALFTDGVRIIESKGGVPVLGVIPYIHDVGVSEEDAVAIDTPQAQQGSAGIDIAVIRLPHIANFDDFDPLAAEPGVSVRYVDSVGVLGRPAAIILPGTKSTMADLDWLRRSGLAQAIVHQGSTGTPVAGICGGYQMLGRGIADPLHTESARDEAPGLGLLPLYTVFGGQKATHQVRGAISGGAGWLADCAGQDVRGYEIHMGRTEPVNPWLTLTERSGQAVRVLDGSAGAGSTIWGCYMHGLFENTGLRRAWLTSLGWSGAAGADEDGMQANLDRLAHVVEQNLNMAQLEKIWQS
jgi:adenosylcobyric acid synthase